MTEKRKTLTRKQLIVLMLEQEGRCGCGCGVKLDPMTEGVIDEHMNPLGLTGTNDTGNRRLLRKPCAKAKTDDADMPRITKARRQAREVGQQARRAKRDKPLIVSRGFQKDGPKVKIPSRPWPKKWGKD
jgi:hypothetical protein